jgi:outer membrane protein assembly factor BamC
MSMILSCSGRVLIAVIGVLAALHLLGCSSFGGSDSSRGVDYKQARSAPPLEIPPDLTRSTADETFVVPDMAPSASGSASYSVYTGERSAATGGAATPVLLTMDNVSVQRDGDRYWLVVAGEPETVWPQVRNFWLGNDWLLTIDDPRIGIMETDWAENRADIPQGIIRNFLGKLIDSAYTAATRDKFRTRIERGERSGTTEIFLTHRGMVEKLTGSVDAETAVWEPRPRDPELEVEMLRRIAVALGVDEERSDQLVAGVSEAGSGPPRATLIRDGTGRSVLHIDEDFGDAWRMTGLALDRVGFTGEDRDRASGVYYVRYLDPLRDESDTKGLLSSLAFWRDEERKPAQYQIRLQPAAGYTQVSVLNEAGAPDESETGHRILSLLEEQLR